jgi:hypothetical protein
MTETKKVDLKELGSSWLICDPTTGHVYMKVGKWEGEDQVLSYAADIEKGWLPKDRGF